MENPLVASGELQMTSPYTLKEDINHVLRTGEGYTEEIAEWVCRDIKQSLLRQLGGGRVQRSEGTLRVSNLGTPCERKLWYTVNRPSDSKPLPASTLNKFIFGDITESHILGLAMAAGHEVTGLQDTVDVDGIRGSRDCVIDGMLFDVKSASSNSFRKFHDNGLYNDDPFGYLSQLSSYLYGSLHDDTVTYKKHAGFLAFDKQHGHIAVDIYDMQEELLRKKEEVARKKDLVKQDAPPDRLYEPVPHNYTKDKVTGKNVPNPKGNLKLGVQCSYCDFKHECWPGLRTFLYSSGYGKKPVHFTKVVKEPTGKVREVTSENQ